MLTRCKNVQEESETQFTHRDHTLYSQAHTVVHNTELTALQTISTSVFFQRINYMRQFSSDFHNSNLATGVTNICITILHVIAGNHS